MCRHCPPPLSYAAIIVRRSCHHSHCRQSAISVVSHRCLLFPLSLVGSCRPCNFLSAAAAVSCWRQTSSPSILRHCRASCCRHRPPSGAEPCLCHRHLLFAIVADFCLKLLSLITTTHIHQTQPPLITVGLHASFLLKKLVDCYVEAFLFNDPPNHCWQSLLAVRCPEAEAPPGAWVVGFCLIVAEANHKTLGRIRMTPTAA